MATSKKSKSELIKHKVQFKYYAPNAGKVFLTGDFNKWNPIKKLMKKNAKGEWLTRVILPEGEHHYKFIVDGKYENDPGAVRYQENGVGTLNSIRIV